MNPEFSNVHEWVEQARQALLRGVFIAAQQGLPSLFHPFMHIRELWIHCIVSDRSNYIRLDVFLLLDCTAEIVETTDFILKGRGFPKMWISDFLVTEFADTQVSPFFMENFMLSARSVRRS